MRTIIRLERKSWGGRGEHGFIDVLKASQSV